MSHTVHPYAHRLGIIKDWKSRWFGVKGEYKANLKGDIIIREFLDKKLRGMYVGGIEIERSQKFLRVIIETSRPGLIIGRNGESAQKLRDELIKTLRKNDVLTKQELRIDVKEVRSPEANARIVAEMLSEGLEKRLPFRRVMKQMIEKVMANRDVQGVRFQMGGRLGGAEMARTEKMKKGRVPLQTFRADVDFARYRANLPYGVIGIKVWIYKGDVFGNKKVDNK
jgi:small subunit ribosomal protein S3